MRRINYDENMFAFLPQSYPTDEDTLDVNFWSIVSDIKALMKGTLVPRSWADISSTWDNYEPSRYERKPEPDHVKEKRKAKYERNKLVKRMTKILVKNGMRPMQAYALAVSQLNSTTTNGVK